MNRSMAVGLGLSAVLLVVPLAVTTAVRAAPEAAAREIPPPNDRLYVKSSRDLRVTTAVPSAAETETLFGVALYDRNIQPVWIRIENLGDEELWFLPVGLDESYFTPIETSYRRQGRIPVLNPLTNRDYYDKRIRLRLGPGSMRSGYLFSRVDEGTKSFNVDIVGRDSVYQTTFFVPVPGLRLDHYDVDWESIYGEDELLEVDREGLAAALAALPCCVHDKSGENTGDPLNIVVVGEIGEAYHAFMRAGWDETETIYTSSLWNTIKSSLSGSEYRYSPVSALYVFGRAQDVALQKARGSIDERNHLRLWLTPIRHQGKPVWIGQISRDIGVRLTWKTITTHKIDPDVDETREYLVEDLAYAQSLAGFGYVEGVGRQTFDNPRGNLTGDPWFTDGLRVVLYLSAQPTDISEIETIDLGVWPATKTPRAEQ
jgi:hypothetical protein